MKQLLPAALVLLVACNTPRALTTQPSVNNVDYKVSYLFEHDGCKVYRFYDRGNYVYFTSCQGEAIAATDSTSVRNSTNLKRK